MAKLYFRYGVVSSAKTLNLIAVAHNYKNREQLALVMKPLMDTRFSTTKVVSRAGLEITADILIDGDNWLDYYGNRIAKCDLSRTKCILVDEAQFLSPKVIDELRVIATNNNIPVICYGLRTDFQANLFPGSKRLLEIADSIEEIKTTCRYCNRKAIFNMRYDNGVPVFTGEQVLLGADSTYSPVCASHYSDQVLSL